MTKYETVLTHMSRGTTYSWDLTALYSLGIEVPSHLREKLLQSTTSADEVDYVRSAYAGKQPDDQEP